MSFELTNSLFLQLGNGVVKESKFESISFGVLSPEENVGTPEAGEVRLRLCPSDEDVARKDDVVRGISTDFTEGVASWTGESVCDSGSELVE